MFNRRSMEWMIRYCQYNCLHGTQWNFRKVLEEKNRRNSDSFYFRLYILVLGVYAGIRLVFAFLLKFRACHALSEMSDQSFFQFFKWIYEVFMVQRVLRDYIVQRILMVYQPYLFCLNDWSFPGAIFCGPWSLWKGRRLYKVYFICLKPVHFVCHFHCHSFGIMILLSYNLICTFAPTIFIS